MFENNKVNRIMIISHSTIGIQLHSAITVCVILTAMLTMIACSGDSEIANSPDNQQWQIQSYDYSGGRLEIISGFKKPYGVTVTPDGTMYVSDLGEGRVIRFSRRLHFTGWLGMMAGAPTAASGWHTTGLPVQGTEIGMMNMPHSVDFDHQGNIFVADYLNGRIHKYSPSGTFLGLFFDPPSSPELAFHGPANAHFDREFNLWVSDFDLHRVVKFAPDGSLIGWLGEKAGGGLTGGFVTSGSAQGSGALGGFLRPHMARVNHAGDLLVVETGNHRVQRFSSNGTFIGWIGANSNGTLTDGWQSSGLSGPSSLPGGFNAPVSLQLLDGDTMIITDNGNHRIQKFGPDGRFIAWLGAWPAGG
jgi:tripartite motif-containing protein 71